MRVLIVVSLLLFTFAAGEARAQDPCRCGFYRMLDEVHYVEQGCDEGEVRPGYTAGSYCCEDDRRTGGSTVNDVGECGDPSEVGKRTYWNCNFRASSCVAGDDLMCDARDGDSDGNPDEGCPNGACDGPDRDEYPVRFSSGRVEIDPKVLFSVAAPNGMFFGVALSWLSHARRDPSDVWYGNQTATNFYGRGWLDAYDDRLIVSEPMTPPLVNPPPTIGWQSFDRSIRFDYVSTTNGIARYVSPGEELELLDFGTGAIPQYRITSPLEDRVFEFRGIDDTVPSEPAIGRAAVLTRIASTGYAIDIGRDSFGRTNSVTDTFGRSLSFSYEDPTAYVRRVASIRYTAPAASPVVVARFIYTTENPLILSAMLRGNTAARGYLRFRHFSPALAPGETCPDCQGMISEVIESVTSAALPLEESPPGAGERVTEGHIYTRRDRRPTAIGSYGPGHRWGYLYDGSSGCENGGACRTVQVDLQHPTGDTCDRDTEVLCPGGSECWSEDQEASTAPCYLATYIESNGETRRVVSRTGHLLAGDEYYDHDTRGRLLWKIDGNGVRTTYSYDSQGRVACVVEDDDNGTAGTPPLCNAPLGAIVTVKTYNGNTETTQRAGLLPGSAGITETVELDAGGRVITKSITGSTRTLEGATIMQTRTYRYEYDAYGRVITRRQPDDDGTTFFDRRSYTYNALGLVETNTRRIGPANATRVAVIRYENYDDYGVPHRLTEPSGRVTTRTISADRLLWIEDVGSPALRTEVRYHLDGSLRYVIDPDGVCHTYEPRAGVSLIKRSSRGDASCGTIPIDESSGEVARFLHNGPGWKITSRELLSAGNAQFAHQYLYDELDRPSEVRVGGSTRLHYEYDRTFRTATEWGAVRTEYLPDGRGRLETVRRILSPGSALESELIYDVTNDVAPSAIIRGALSSEFVTDDFGQLVESETADGGVTRSEYDALGRLTRRREGVGTAEVRTSVHSYDTYHRPIGIDHDVEHPVDCASAVNGTAIADVVYRYDNCSTDVPAGFSCNNADGRRTMDRALLACQNGQVWSRSTWYSYDAHGRVLQTATAEKTGAVFGASRLASYEHTNSGLPRFVGNPLTSSLGTKSTYRLDGRLSRVDVAASGSANNPSRVALYDNYLSFGPPREITLGATLRLNVGYNSDHHPWSWTWTRLLIQQIRLDYVYDPGGYLRTRNASGTAPPPARHLARDGAGRVTCESTSAPCSSGFTYFNGTSSAEPVDQRATAGGETYEYQAGTSRLSRISRANGIETIYTHDALGRRTGESEALDPSQARVYRYNPDGRLGTITGRSANGSAYALHLHRDVRGRVTHVVDSSSGSADEYFYDLHDHLIAAQRTPSPAPPAELIGVVYDPSTSRYTTFWGDYTYAIGTSYSALDNVQPRSPFARRHGSPTSIVGVTRNSSGDIISYYSDGVVMSGTAANPVGTAFNFTVATGKLISQIVAIAWDWQNTNRVYAWYSDGTYSVGDQFDLDRYGTGQFSSGTYDRRVILAITFRPHGIVGFRTDTFHSSGRVLQGSATSLTSISTANTWVEPPASPVQRWAFHWGGPVPLASTRELVSGTTAAARLYHVFDERGVPLAITDASGNVLANVTTTLWGGRSISASTGDPLWIPFALEGQVLLDRTSATISSGFATFTKPPLALNGAREYDPATGRFLEPDPADVVPRQDPEGYVFARNDPSSFSDPTGNFSVDGGCSIQQKINLYTAAVWAMTMIRDCGASAGGCGPNFADGWIQQLTQANFLCKTSTELSGDCAASDPIDTDEIWMRDDLAATFREEPSAPENTPYTDPTIGCDGTDCLAQTMSHEALHQLDFDLWENTQFTHRAAYSAWDSGRPIMRRRRSAPSPLWFPNVSNRANALVQSCVFCDSERPPP